MLLAVGVNADVSKFQDDENKEGKEMSYQQAKEFAQPKWAVSFINNL